MAKSKNKKTLRDDPTPFISRSYDPFSMEKRIYNLEQGGVGPTPSSWDYSTTETDTNQKWIDGSEIYSIVLDYSSSPQTLPANSEKTFSGVLPANAQIIDVGVIYGNGSWFGIASPYVTLNSGTLGINSFHSVTMYYVIVKYIKTGA